MPGSTSPRFRRYARRALWQAAWFCLVMCLTAMGVAQYRYTVWTAEEGLPQNVVRGLAQTQDGYLWIATLDGLVRFDGVRFTVFNKSNTEGIATNRFFKMFTTPNGDLWLPAEGGHLTRVHAGVFHTFDVDILGITGDMAGNVWILQNDSSILEWDESHGGFHPVVRDAAHSKYRPLYWNNAGFWASDAGGLHCFVGGRFMTRALPAGIAYDNVGVVALDRDGAIWMETGEKRHLRIAPDGVVGPLSQPNETMASTYVDAKGHAWDIHIGFHLSREIEFTESGNTSRIVFSALLEDHEKNLWLGSEGRGLFRLQMESIRVLTKEQGLVDRNVYPIFQARDGAVWVGAWGSGLSRIDHDGIRNFTVADGLPNGKPTALAQDRDGRIWVGTHGGLATFDGTRFHSATEPVLPPTALVQDIHQARDGTLWFGTTVGLVGYRDGASEMFTTASGMATNDVRSIVEDQKDGGLWVGGYGGLTRMQQGRFTRWTEQDGLPSNQIRALYQDAESVLWIGTYDGGLGRLKDGKFTRFTEREGMFSNGVFQILDDGHDGFWISCNRGIYRLSRRELNEFAAGALSSVTSIAYGKADGMLNVECNGGAGPAGTRTSDGRMWFPTQDGVAIIDPRNVRHDSQPPPVAIESVTADQVRLPLNVPLRIKPEYENVEIQYTGLSFINSAQIRFRYRLEGHDSKWVDAGTRRTAYYSHLPPGRYVFRVTALNGDGVWNSAGNSVSLTILAPFYKTWWFLGLVIVAGVMLLYWTWHRRIAQLERAQTVQETFSRELIASQENERKRIAGELHDSIGQRLVMINHHAQLFLHSSRKNEGDQSGASEMEAISTEAVSAIAEARSIAYNLRPFQLDQLGLTKAIGAMARTVSSASGIEVDAQIDTIDTVFDEELRINFYRIVQESLNNVMKHAHATQVRVRVKLEEHSVTLAVEDNGRGIPHALRHGESIGFGMTGMAERAHLLGGRLEMHSSPGQGLTLMVTIPLVGVSRG